MSSEDILNVAPPPADQRLSYGADANQFGDLRLPKLLAHVPAVMMIHGGFWRARYDLVHAGHLCAALTSKGIATWNMEYRRVGDALGGWPGTVHDIAAGYRYLKQKAPDLKIDANKILVMGHSAGGHLAVWLAAHEPSLKHVMPLAGVLDLERAYQLHLSNDAVSEFLGGSPAQVPEHYSEADPMQFGSVTAHQYVVHGTADDIVPIELSRNYCHKNKTKQVTLVEIAGADHFDVINPQSAAWQKIEAVVVRALSAQGQ